MQAKCAHHRSSVVAHITWLDVKLSWNALNQKSAWDCTTLVSSGYLLKNSTLFLWTNIICLKIGSRELLSWLLRVGSRIKVKVTFRLPDRINKIIKNRIQVRCSAQEGRTLHLAKISSIHRNKRHRQYTRDKVLQCHSSCSEYHEQRT